MALVLSASTWRTLDAQPTPPSCYIGQACTVNSLTVGAGTIAYANGSSSQLVMSFSSGNNTFTIQPNGAANLALSGAGGGTTTLGLPVISFATPASSTSGCAAGQIQADGTYLYVCVASNTWRRLTPAAF